MNYGENKMSNTDPRPGFWSRLGRAFINFFKFLLLVLILVAIVLGAWYGYRQLLAPTILRADANSQRIGLLRSDVDNLMADTADADAVATLEAEVAALEAQVEANHTALAADLQDQQEMLTGLQVQVAGLVTNTVTAGEEIDTLQSGLVALQTDLNTNSTMVDELGGALDRVEADLAALDAEFTAVRQDAGELAQMQRSLTLFRVWELISRSRLHLVEGNAGLAQDDVRTALATVNGILATDTAAEAPADAALADLQQRLELALQNLPQDPSTAGRDLQTAWEILDHSLASMVGIEEVEASVPLSGTQTITATTPVTSTTP